MTTYADHTPDKAGLPKTADQKEITVDKSTDIPVANPAFAKTSDDIFDDTVNRGDISNDLMHIKDVNSHEIFKSNVLTSQFLRDYTGLDIFSDIKPEDIEDQTQRFRLMLGIEVEGDTIKKVHIHLDEYQEDIFVITIVEHKSESEYNITMQLLNYMVMIWRDYARNENENRKNASRLKNFRYPPIIPIVYYEGTGIWNAEMRLSDRIAHADLAREYIPDFRYQVIPLKKYDNNELKQKNNEMSLIMMINKIQGKEDFHEFRITMLDYFKTIYLNTSAEIQELILRVTWGLLMKVKVPPEEARQVLMDVKEGGEGNMGILFEHFEEFDYKEAREEARLAKEETRKYQEQARLAEEKAERQRRRADEAERLLAEFKAKAGLV